MTNEPLEGSTEIDVEPVERIPPPKPVWSVVLVVVFLLAVGVGSTLWLAARAGRAVGRWLRR